MSRIVAARAGIFLICASGLAITSVSAQQTDRAMSAGPSATTLPPVVVSAPKRRQATSPLRSRPTGGPRTAAARRSDQRQAAAPPGAAMTAGARQAVQPVPYTGGQVARGARLGLLGNRDYIDTPFSTTSYTDQTIRNMQAISAAEVLSTTDPSVRAAIGSTNRYDALTIRGFRVDNNQFMLNGLHGLVPNFRTNPAPAERIELLKGPAAFLNGMSPSGTIGGSVNIVTKRAGDDPLTRVTLGYISDSRLTTLVDIARRYGEQKEWGVRFNGGFENGKTTIDHQSVRDGVGSLGVDYRTDRFRWSADLIYQDDFMRSAARGYTPLKGFQVPAAPDPRINIGQPFDYSKAQNVTGLTRAELDLSDAVTVFGAVGANRFAYDKREDPGATILNAAGDARSVSRFQTGNSEAVSGEAGIRGHFETGPFSHELVVSGNALTYSDRLGQTDYQTYLTNIYRPVILTSPGAVVPGNSFGIGKSSSQDLRSVGAADTVSMLDGAVQVIAGVRQQQVISSGFSPATGAQTTHYDQGATSPSIAIVVRPLRYVSVYANYIEGLSPGPTPPSNAVNTGQVFAPYKTRQAEVGTKFDFGHFGASIALFQMAMPSGFIDPSTGVYGLDGEQRHRGIELATFGEVAAGLRVLGGVTFLDARLTKTQGGLNNGNRAVGTADLQANFGVEWDTPFVPGLTAIARTIYTSSSYVSADNLQSVPSWATFDIGARYATTLAGRPTTFRATVTNLLDKRYWVANPSGYVISGAGRTALLSMTMDF